MRKIMLLIGILMVGNILLAQGEQQARQRAEVKIDEYKERLELTEDQVSEWREMREKYKPELKVIRTDDSKSKADKMRAAADIMDKQEEALTEILSENQFAELQVVREEVKKKRAERRKTRRTGTKATRAFSY